MKKVYVASVQPDPEGPAFGRVIDPNDIQKLQDFSHAHITQIVKDLLVAGAAGAQVAGFLATAAGGMNVSVATGSVVDQNGVSYDGPEAAFVVAIPAAHVALPRKDLIFATIAIDTAAESEFKPFRQLRTQAELEAGTDPYIPTQFDQPTELHTSATIGVRAGVANAVPVAPAAGANEVPLYEVSVAAGAAEIVGGNLTSVRVLMKSLFQAFLDIAALQAQISVGGLSEIVQDVVGAFVVASTSIVPTYNDAGNVESLALHSTYKSMLDDATDANTASKLVKRDASGHVRVSEAKMDTGARFTSDSSLRRFAFERETFVSLLDVNTPVSFTGAVAGVYETVKRVSATTILSEGSGNFTAFPEFDCYVDPADLQNVLCKLEVYGLHTGNVWGTDVQIWNATDSAALASVNFDWLAVTWAFRSTAFSISGSGHKRLVVRARNNTSVVAAASKIWRVRLVFNPSF